MVSITCLLAYNVKLFTTANNRTQLHVLKCPDVNGIVLFYFYENWSSRMCRESGNYLQLLDTGRNSCLHPYNLDYINN